MYNICFSVCTCKCTHVCHVRERGINARNMQQNMATMHTCKLAHTGKYTNTHAHARTRMHTHAHTRTPTNTHAHTYTQAPTHKHTHTRTHANAHAHTHTITYKYAHTHTHPLSRTNTYINTRTDTYTNALHIHVHDNPSACVMFSFLEYYVQHLQNLGGLVSLQDSAGYFFLRLLDNEKDGLLSLWFAVFCTLPHLMEYHMQPKRWLTTCKSMLCRIPSACFNGKESTTCTCTYTL